MIVSMATARPRRLEHTESTRQALVNSAVVLFTKKGYGGTSLDEIAKRARVTKGALYHHFSGKQALFEAAFEEVEQRVVRRLSKVLFGSGSTWDAVRAGLDDFIQVCLEPSYQRIVVHEAPAVMGWERWREAEERYTFGVIRQAVQALVEAGEITPLPVDALAHVVFGALSAGASTIAGSAKQKQTSTEVGQVVDRVLRGLRTQ